MQQSDPIAPLIVDFDSRIVEDRYLLVPVCADTDKLKDGSKSVYDLPYISAWRGLDSMTEDQPWRFYRTDLNLIVVDLQSGHVAKVFDRQVALAGFESAFGPGNEPAHGSSLQPARQFAYKPNRDCVLRFPGYLILIGRTTDTNGDRAITDEDAIEVFAFNLATRERKTLTPAGYSTRNVRFTRDKVILLLDRIGDGVSVYECDPVSAEGRLLAESLGR